MNTIVRGGLAEDLLRSEIWLELSTDLQKEIEKTRTELEKGKFRVMDKVREKQMYIKAIRKLLSLPQEYIEAKEAEQARLKESNEEVENG